jgi:hypothetical protein
MSIYDAEGNRISEYKTTSILEYAMQKLSTSTNSEFKVALVDMLNYGAAAQVKFKYNAENLVNAGLTDEQKALATTNVKEVENKRESDSNYFAGSNLRFENKINMIFAFKNISRDTYAVFTWTSHDGKAKSVRVDGADYSVQSGRYIVELESDIVVADARQMVICTIYDFDGNVITYVADSVEGNVARVSEANREFYESFMKFADSAYAYLH